MLQCGIILLRRDFAWLRAMPWICVRIHIFQCDACGAILKFARAKKCCSRVIVKKNSFIGRRL